MQTTETSSLDEIFYRHFFSTDPHARESAEEELDEHFGQLATNGVSRYEITRQMICAIVNAQDRRDAEIAGEANFATTNGKPNKSGTESPTAKTAQRIASGVSNIFWIILLLALAAFALPKVW